MYHKSKLIVEIVLPIMTCHAPDDPRITEQKIEINLKHNYVKIVRLFIIIILL